jgi:hypothetical protein
MEAIVTQDSILFALIFLPLSGTQRPNPMRVYRSFKGTQGMIINLLIGCLTDTFFLRVYHRTFRTRLTPLPITCAK